MSSHLFSPRISRVFSFADRALGAFMATSIVLLGGTVVAITGGPPTRGEINEFGSAYVSFLGNVEASVHQLRAEACNNACLPNAAASEERATPPVRFTSAEERVASAEPAAMQDKYEPIAYRS